MRQARILLQAMPYTPVAEEHEREGCGARHSAPAGIDHRGNQLPRLTGGIEGQQAPVMRLRRLVELRAAPIIKIVGLPAELAAIGVRPRGVMGLLSAPDKS